MSKKRNASKNKENTKKTKEPISLPRSKSKEFSNKKMKKLAPPPTSIKRVY